MQIFIKGNVPSSKNSRQWTGKYLIMSKTCQKYIKYSQDEWFKNYSKFQEMIKGKEKPYKVGFYFIRDSRRAFDYINALQLPLDLMQDFAWIDDDNMENVIPIILGYEVDKENTGVRIEVL